MEAYSVPGKVNGVDMKKVLAHIAVSAIIPLTIALVACGDEKTSNAIDLGLPATSVVDTTTNEVNQESDNIDSDLDTNTVSQESDSISVESDSASSKTVLANSGPCSLNYTNGGNLAYLTNNENVGYQIIIPDASAIGYYTDTELKAERIGDTLEVMYPSDTIVILDWICYVYYTFNIPAEDADVKYLKYIRNVYKVVPGPAPEKAPDTSCVRIPSRYRASEDGDNDSTFCIITTFSWSAEGTYDTTKTFFPYDIYQSSSSNSAKSSSSSAAKVAGTHQVITDAVIQCKNDRRTLDRPVLSKTTFAPDFDTTSAEHIAGRIVGDDGFDTIIINELDVGCDVENVDFDVSASNDTLFVQPSAGLFGTNCICPSRIDFKIEQNSRFSNTNVLVFGHFEPMPLVTTVPVTFRPVRQE